MIYYFSIEGSIGAGKSTLIRKLEKELTNVNQFPVKYLSEPVNLWSSIRNTVFDKNILEKFYEDQTKYSFSFQVLILTTLAQQIKEIQSENKDCILITERSLFASMEVFTKMLLEDKKLQKFEFDILHMLFEQLTNDIELCGIIYLDTPVDECHTRILKRNRSGEMIDMDYLTRLELYYKRFISNHRTLILNGDNHDKIEKFVLEWSSYKYLSSQ